MTLEQMLIEMDAYGHPRLTKLGDGWHAAVEMHVNATGAEFKVRSEFAHATPSDAAAECLSRLNAVLQNIRGQRRIER